MSQIAPHDPNAAPTTGPLDAALDAGTALVRYGWRGTKRLTLGAAHAAKHGALLGLIVYVVLVFTAWALPAFLLAVTLGNVGALAAFLWLPALLVLVGAPWTRRGRIAGKGSPNWWDRLPGALTLPSVGLIRGGQANAGTVAARMVGRAERLDDGVMAVYDLLGGITWRQVEAKRDVIASALRVDEDLMSVEKMPTGGQVSVFVRSAGYVADPATAREAATVERITAALTPLLVTAGGSGDALAVSVALADEHGRPEHVEVAYPPAASARVHGAQHDAADTMARLYPAKTGAWTVSNDPARDVLTLTVRVDPLAGAVALAPITQTVDLTAGPVIGVQQDGSPWRLPLLGRHTLVGGMSGSGKGSPLHATVRALGPMVAAGTVRLMVCDPKGGVEFDEVDKIAHRFAVEPAEVADLLDDAVAGMRANLAAIRVSGGRKMEKPTRAVPFTLVIVDELSAVIGDAASSGPVQKRSAEALALLLSQGRAAGFSVLGAVQDPRKGNVPSRGLFTTTIGLRLNASEVDLILGPGARDAGARCDLIPQGQPGTAYVGVDGAAGFSRVRAAYVDSDEPARYTATVHAAMLAAGTTTEPEPDDEREPEPVPALLTVGADLVAAGRLARLSRGDLYAALPEDVRGGSEDEMRDALTALGVKQKGFSGGRFYYARATAGPDSFEAAITAREGAHPGV